MFPRFNSTLSQYKNEARRFNNKARRFVYEHTGMSVAVAVAGIAAVGAVVGPAPWAEAAIGASTANYAGPGTSQQTPSQPYMFYDSVEPYAVPAGQPVATYADGPFATSPLAVAGHGKVLWIDVNGSDPQAGALDVEPGDATPGIAAQWAQQRLTQQPNATAIVYTTRAEWPLVQAAIGTLPSSMQSHVKYWVADPNGIPHMVPGASATQWYWGGTYDISTAEPGFF